jgi:3-oxoacyl-[acyl-carrier protein] reductase
MSSHGNQAKSFGGKNVLVTGGGRGLGLEIARQFARAGATLHLFDVEAGLLAKAAGEIGREGVRVFTTEVDVSRREAVERAVAATEAIAPVDVLVNNAGIARETGFLHIEEREWRQIIDVNLTGMFFVAQAVCRAMVQRRRGVVINMGSKNGLAGEAGYAHYNASKGGVIMLTQTMALELAPLGLRVNAVCPGYIETPMSREIDPPEFVRDFVERYIPAGRPGSVEDVAPMFLFLAGEGAAFINGQVFVLDGGQLAGQKASPELLARLNPLTAKNQA